MKVLLDECVPRRLARDLAVEHRVTTVPRQGWAGLKDSELLKLIPGEFDVWITIDANMRYQQSVENSGFLLLVIRAKSNRYEYLKPFVPDILSLLREGIVTGVREVGLSS